MNIHFALSYSTRILESLHVDYTHVIVKGKLITTGDASLIDEINEKGFTRFEQLAAEDELK